MKCDTCQNEYDAHDVKCAYCTHNPRIIQDNYRPKRIDLSKIDLEVDSFNLDPDGNWGWHIEQDMTYNKEVFYLYVYFDELGIQLKRIITIPDRDGQKWFEEKTRYVADRFNLPLDKCTALAPKVRKTNG